MAMDALANEDFNPRPPHGGRRWIAAAVPEARQNFNPRPPHGGRRQTGSVAVLLAKFQSTPSAWRATAKMNKSDFDFLHICQFKALFKPFISKYNRSISAFHSI